MVVTQSATKCTHFVHTCSTTSKYTLSCSVQNWSVLSSMRITRCMTSRTSSKGAQDQVGQETPRSTKCNTCAWHSCVHMTHCNVRSGESTKCNKVHTLCAHSVAVPTSGTSSWWLWPGPDDSEQVRPKRYSRTWNHQILASWGTRATGPIGPLEGPSGIGYS